MVEEKRRSRLPSRSTIAIVGGMGTLAGTAIGGYRGEILGRAEGLREAEVRAAGFAPKTMPTQEELERIVNSYAEFARDLQGTARRSGGNAAVRSDVERSAAYHLGALEAHRAYARGNSRLVSKIDRAIQGFRSIARGSR